MSIGEACYLVMCLAMFMAFAIVLGYHSWQQSRHGGDFGAPEPARSPGSVPGATQAHA